MDSQSVQQMISVLLHSADVSNVTKPWVLSRKWANRIHSEFLDQVSGSSPLNSRLFQWSLPALEVFLGHFSQAEASSPRATWRRPGSCP